MANGLTVEVEELGVVALIGLLAVPGLSWVVGAKTNASAMRRLLMVSGVMLGALALEAALDRSANAVVGAIEQ